MYYSKIKNSPPDNTNLKPTIHIHCHDQSKLEVINVNFLGLYLSPQNVQLPTEIYKPSFNNWTTAGNLNYGR